MQPIKEKCEAVYESSLPLNRGTARHIEIGPSEANCPNANSIKNRGIPQMSNIMAYGIRKAPAIRSNSN